MILISNLGPSLGFFSGASDTPGTQEASRVFLSKVFTEKGSATPKSASYPCSFCVGL